MISRPGARSAGRCYWAKGRAASASSLVVLTGLAVMLLTRQGPGGTGGAVPASLAALIAVPHLVQVLHPAGTRLAAEEVSVRSWWSRWRPVRREQVAYVDISASRWASALVLTDGSRVTLPGLPREAARALALAGPVAAQQVTASAR